MSNLHETVRERCAGAITNRCRKGNCRLGTQGLSLDATTIVDVDETRRRGHQGGFVI